MSTSTLAPASPRIAHNNDARLRHKAQRWLLHTMTKSDLDSVRDMIRREVKRRKKLALKAGEHKCT